MAIFILSKKTKTDIFIQGIGLLINVACGFFLAKFYGGFGSAIGLTLSSFISFLCYVVLSSKDISYKQIFKKLLKPLISTIIMIAFVLLINFIISKYSSLSNGFFVLIDCISGVVVYFSSSLLFKDEIAIMGLTNVFKKAKNKKR